MSIPALEAIRTRFPSAHITILAPPWVADLYQGAAFCDQVLLYRGERWSTARVLRGIGFDAAVMLPNSFDSALTPWLARIPERIGYARDGRSLLLTRAIAPPRKGEIPEHERFYYLEVLRRAGWIESWPEGAPVRLTATPRTLDHPAIGVSPGAAFGTAKRWLSDRFAEAAVRLANELQSEVLVFGTKDETDVCADVTARVSEAGVKAANMAGRTSLREFIEYTAACRLFLTNDNGAMHIASALGVPTVVVFGATNHIATGPTGNRTVIIRENVDCSPYTNPCMRRECPIDHRCMSAVTADRVVKEALTLLG